jgi:hypothetical protein
MVVDGRIKVTGGRPCRRKQTVEKILRVARSFEECDRVEKDYYRGLTPQQRLEILFELNSRWPAPGNHEDPGRLKRVCKVIKLS